MTTELTPKQQEYIEAVERNTAGLTAVSTGPCPGCKQCRDEYGITVPCECQNLPDCEGEPDPFCDDCDGHGDRQPTMAEFSEQWSNGKIVEEGGFSWDGCDICGSSLGGTMEPWHGVDSSNKIIHGDCACVDCVVYLANGDIPDR
jgi:hypothetical protein